MESRILPLIDLRRCSGCALCVSLCPTEAVELRAGKAMIVRPEACTFCDVCESYCPEGAIGRPFRVVFGPPSEPHETTRPAATKSRPLSL
jgi:ferredoxin